MKSKILYLFLVFLSLSFIGTAQQADRVQRGQRGYVPPIQYPNKTYIELQDPYETTNLIVAKCETAFNLDAFQKEIMKGLVMKKIEDDNAILTDEKNNREIRKKKLQEREKQLHRDLASIMNPDQIETFKEMDFSETKEDRKEKKKNRKKKNKNG